MDDQMNTRGPISTGGAAARHRVDSASAARPSNTERAAQGEQGDGYNELTKATASRRDRDRPTQGFDFGVALEYLREGRRVARMGWNGRGQFLGMAFGSFFSGPAISGHQDGNACIVIQPVAGPVVPWVASQTDLLAHDWCFVREVPMLQYGTEGFAVPKPSGAEL